MIKKILILKFIWMIFALHFVTTVFCETTSRDIKNAYVEYELKTDPQSMSMKDEKREEHKQKFIAKLKEIDFNVVDDIKQSDMKITCYFENVLFVIVFGWQTNKASAVFALPRNNLIITEFKIEYALLERVSLDKMEDMLIEKIKKDYEYIQTRFKIASGEAA